MKKHFFFFSTMLLLGLSILGFSDNLFTDIKQESNSDPKFIIHGVFFLAWFIVLVIQSNFIRNGDVRKHRKLGMWGMGIAIGVILSTFYLFYALYEGWAAMPSFVKANRIFTVSFAVLVFLAYLKRKQPIAHKRYLYIGTVYVMGPVIGRVADKLGNGSDLSYLLFEGVIWTAFFFSLFVYDWKTLNKIHRITMFGTIWFYIIWFSTII